MTALALKIYIPWFVFDVFLKIPIFTSKLVDIAIQHSISLVKQSSSKSHLHVILGETGTPFNMGDALSTRNFSVPTDVLDRTLRAVEANDLDYILWNYCHENTYEEGDWWNGEDLSIRAEGRNRGLASVIRPYVLSHGQGLFIVRQKFHLETKWFQLVIRCNAVNDHSRVENVVIYVPSFHYFSEPSIRSVGSNISNINFDESRQQLVWRGLICPSLKTEFILDIRGEV